MRVSRTCAAMLLAACLPLQSARASGLPGPVTDGDFYENGRPSPEKVELGKVLYWDKLLSGNENISCATCHHSLAATGDGLSLPVGEGGLGLGVTRDTGFGSEAVHERVPRNAPPVFNLGARVFHTMFHDGRVQVDPGQPSGFDSPAGDDLPSGLENVLAAQAMFPVTSSTEMAGQPGENVIADAAADGRLAGEGGVWNLIATRLRDPDNGYVELFRAAYEDIDANGTNITYVHAANAIAAYEAAAFRADQSPFDHYLRGNREAMTPQAQRGMRLFYGRAACSVCHSGKFHSDMDFHAIAMPQIGPGKGNGFEGLDDFGRELVTGDPADRYRFRTPPLRNVALTGPWGHDGAYNTLRGVIEHHLNPELGLGSYGGIIHDPSDPDYPRLPSRPDLDALDFVVYGHPMSRGALSAANELAPVVLSGKDVEDLVAFLYALTDPNSLDMRDTVPQSVPSGLPLAD